MSMYILSYDVPTGNQSDAKKALKSAGCSDCSKGNRFPNTTVLAELDRDRDAAVTWFKDILEPFDPTSWVVVDASWVSWHGPDC
jgi:hypothetical protein